MKDKSGEIHDMALELIKSEKSEWQEELAFITDKIAFRMRELIKELRKNYWGIFEQPKDPTTGRDKVWIPLTETVVDAVVKNIDLDTKDINFRAKKHEALGYSIVIRNIVRNYLDNMGFGELLDEFIRNMATDGTAIWKTVEEPDYQGKKKLCIYNVDLLNFYIDPTARSIAEAFSVIERAVMTPTEVKSMSGWENTEGVEGMTGIHLSDPDNINSLSSAKMVEVWERWGQMPKFLITGKEKDKETMIEGQIVASNVDTDPKVHLIRENKKGVRPYEEAWYLKVNNRFYGRGVAEKVKELQVWLNTIANIRINRSYVSQLGIFKIRKGSGITPDMFSRLAANGALVLNNLEDIEQMDVKEASEASYRDEEIITSWAERNTSAFNVIQGESLPASTPATNAVLQDRNAQSQFVLVKEGLGMFLQRWMNNQCLPIIMKNIKRGDVLRITGEYEELREFDERIVNHMVYKSLEKMNKDGKMFNVEDVQKEREKALKKMEKMGKDRYVELQKEIDPSEFDVQVYITNEEIDKAVMVNNLLTMLQTVGSLPQTGIPPEEIARQIFDLMGLDYIAMGKQQLQVPQGQPSPQMPVPTDQSLTTQANTLPQAAVPQA